jgi:hypothetical protein
VQLAAEGQDLVGEGQQSRTASDDGYFSLNYGPMIDVTNTFKFQISRRRPPRGKRLKTHSSLALRSTSVFDVHHWERSQGGQD